MAESFESAEIVRTAAGRQYHIGLAPEDVAPTVVLVGDPARADKVAAHFDSVTVRRQEREYVTRTGTYKGRPLSVMATGIGCDNTEIAVVELCQLIENPTFLRIGSCGALQDDMELGDLVISSGAVRLENTTSWFVSESFPAVAHHEVILCLLQACAEAGQRHHLGLTATGSGFYGAQARKVPGFQPRFPEMPEKLKQAGVKNFEMEASALFVLSQLVGARAGAVCAAYAHRPTNRFVDTDAKSAAEAQAIACGLRAIELLWQMDAQKGAAQHWHPGLSSA